MTLAPARSAEDLGTEAAVVPRPRLDFVDLLRGVVMVVMILDHTRDFFAPGGNPTDIGSTTPALFFTRWVTHFCAPVFMFLAGAGAFLYGMRGKSRREVAWFLFTRGVWLIFLELTVARLGLMFTMGFSMLPAIVLWALGGSMIALSVLVFLPTPAIAAIGLVMIAGHNAFDGVRPESLGAIGGAIWKMLHIKGGRVELFPNVQMFVLYPLVPWIGVMATGYAFGEVLRLDRGRRRRVTLGLGLAAIALFVGLRAWNVYGDPNPWSVRATPLFTVLSFLNCEKYPPSLLYLLMTLGPALVALAAFDRADLGPLSRPFVTLGRVPLFYYLLQWPTIHILAILVAIVAGRPYQFLVNGGPFGSPEGYDYSLPFVYLMWGVVVLLLYPPCAAFARLKKRRRDAWLSYF